MGKNVAVFVDVANIFYAAKAAGVDIDYVTLLKASSAGRDLVRAYAYTGLDPDNENQRNFHDFLRRSGYKVVSKDIRKYGDGKVKANLDIELVVDMMKTARNLDVAIVVSGDGDFAPAIRAVQEQGVRVEVVSFRGNTSSDLMDVADQFTDIIQIAKVEKGSSRSGRRVAGADDDLSMTEVPGQAVRGHRRAIAAEAAAGRAGPSRPPTVARSRSRRASPRGGTIPRSSRATLRVDRGPAGREALPRGCRPPPLADARARRRRCSTRRRRAEARWCRVDRGRESIEERRARRGGLAGAAAGAADVAAAAAGVVTEGGFAEPAEGAERVAASAAGAPTDVDDIEADAADDAPVARATVVRVGVRVRLGLADRRPRARARPGRSSTTTRTSTSRPCPSTS